VHFKISDVQEVNQLL